MRITICAAALLLFGWTPDSQGGSSSSGSNASRSSADPTPERRYVFAVPDPRVEPVVSKREMLQTLGLRQVSLISTSAVVNSRLTSSETHRGGCSGTSWSGTFGRDTSNAFQPPWAAASTHGVPSSMQPPESAVSLHRAHTGEMNRSHPISRQPAWSRPTRCSIRSRQRGTGGTTRADHAGFHPEPRTRALTSWSTSTR
jgi:hypothetical protein